MVRAPELTLLQGTLDVLVLKALSYGANHGYAVASWIRSSSTDALHVEDGALYTSLHRMERRGWLESTWGTSENNRRAKYYQLTRKGRRQLDVRTQEWTHYAEAVFRVLAAPGPEVA